MNRSDRWDNLIEFWCSIYAQDWRLAKAQMLRESMGNPRAVSVAGARGLWQFMPATWQEWGAKLSGCDPRTDPSPHDPDASTRARCEYWRWLTEHTNSIEAALAAYNWGIGNVWNASKKHGPGWLEHAPAETRVYVDWISRKYELIRNGG